MNNSQTSVYVDTSTLKIWETEINKINDEALKNLSLYLNTINKLQDYMAGNVISGFIKDTTNLINKLEKKHKNMDDVEKFLDEVVNTMNEQ